MKKLLLSTMLLLMITVQGQITKDFGKQIQALIEAEAPDLMTNQIESNENYTSYRTALKLDNFEIKYILSGIIGFLLTADYQKKGDNDVMEAIFVRLNTTPYLIYDSEYRADEIKLDNDTLRKILVKSNKTGKTLLIITLTKSNKIHLWFKQI